MPLRRAFREWVTCPLLFHFSVLWGTVFLPLENEAKTLPLRSGDWSLTRCQACLRLLDSRTSQPQVFCYRSTKQIKTRWTLNQVTGILVGERPQEMQNTETRGKEALGRQRQRLEWAREPGGSPATTRSWERLVLILPRASRRQHPADALILDFKFPELWENRDSVDLSNLICANS